MLSSDGKVAQHGSYEQLSQDPNSAFTQLMEWQMSGGETNEDGKGKSEMQSAVSKSGIEDDGDIIEAMAEETEAEAEEDEQDPNANNEARSETVDEIDQKTSK